MEKVFRWTTPAEVRYWQGVTPSERVAAVSWATSVIARRRPEGPNGGGMGVSQDTFLASAWANQRTLRLADGSGVHIDQIGKLELAKHRRER